jgi:hypothetical protein
MIRLAIGAVLWGLGTCASAQTCETLAAAIDGDLKRFSFESIGGPNEVPEGIRLARAAISLHLVDVNLRLMEAHKCPPIKEPVGPVYAGAAHRCNLAARSIGVAGATAAAADDACDKSRWVRGSSVVRPGAQLK